MRCSKCGITKSEDDFSWKVAGKRRRTECKDCAKAYRRNRYASDLEYRKKVRDAVRAGQDLKTGHCRDVLKQSTCVDCGNGDYRVLEFDHLPQFAKRAGVMALARGNASIADLDEEMAKCEVRCANCHKIKTYERGGWTY